MHAALAAQVHISVSHVRYLYQQVSLPLLACHERQHQDRLAQVAKHQGGLILALDGVAPQGGEPHIWFIRELASGLTIRSGWLCQQDQPTFDAFLEPLTHLEWLMLAVLSDKQTGLVPAVAAVLPPSRHPRCQAHSLRNLAEPLAEAEAACKGALRKSVRQQVGHLLRQEPPTEPGQVGVLTMTGLWPSPLKEPKAPVSHRPTPRVASRAPEPDADEVVAQLLGHTRSLLTLTGRPPFRLAGIETSERLDTVARFPLERLAQCCEPGLAPVAQRPHGAFAPLVQALHAFPPRAPWPPEILADL